LFEFGEEMPSKLGSSLEVVVVGRVVAMLLVHVLVDRNETMPLGIITDHSDQVARLEAQLHGEHSQLWIYRPRQRQDGTGEESKSSRALDLSEE
jgi:hypothetical protein